MNWGPQLSTFDDLRLEGSVLLLPSFASSLNLSWRHMTVEISHTHTLACTRAHTHTQGCEPAPLSSLPLSLSWNAGTFWTCCLFSASEWTTVKPVTSECLTVAELGDLLPLSHCRPDLHRFLHPNLLSPKVTYIWTYLRFFFFSEKQTFIYAK